jgi:hypothetical protein
LSITNLKKLYGSPYANTGTTNTNVWLSNKLTNNINFYRINNSEKQFLQKHSFINNNVFLTNYVDSIAFYENSIFWLTKRFIFTQLLTKNQSYLDNAHVSYSGRLGTQKIKNNLFDFVKSLVFFNNPYFQMNLVSEYSFVSKPTTPHQDYTVLD